MTKKKASASDSTPPGIKMGPHSLYVGHSTFAGPARVPLTEDEAYAVREIAAAIKAAAQAAGDLARTLKSPDPTPFVSFDSGRKF